MKSVHEETAGASAAKANEHRTILLAIYNMKGGVGKTTSALEMGYLLVRDGFKVLLVVWWALFLDKFLIILRHNFLSLFLRKTVSVSRAF